MLAAVFGRRSRQLVAVNISSPDSSSTVAAATAHVHAFIQDRQKGVLLLSKGAEPVTFTLPFAAGWEGTLLEGVGAEPGEKTTDRTPRTLN